MSVNGVSSNSTGQGVGEMRGMHGPRKLPDEAISALADKLGVSADDLKSKLDAADDPRKVLDQLAEEKGITKQELRETIRAAMPHRAEHGGQGGEGGPPPPPPSGAGGISFDDEVGKKLLSALAEKLGTSADDLKSKLDSGSDLKDILDDSGLSHEDIKSAFEEAFKSWQSYGSNGSTASSSTPAYNAVDVTV
jgi:uncharacterized protein YidB (DUF937 family)